MCTPRLVRVDFIRMKKERSRVLSVVSRLGLVDSTEEYKDIYTRLDLRTAPHSYCSGAILEFTKNKWLIGAKSQVINLPHLENVYFAENKKKN